MMTKHLLLMKASLYIKITINNLKQLSDAYMKSLLSYLATKSTTQCYIYACWGPRN